MCNQTNIVYAYVNSAISTQINILSTSRSALSTGKNVCTSALHGDPGGLSAAAMRPHCEHPAGSRQAPERLTGPQRRASIAAMNALRALDSRGEPVESTSTTVCRLAINGDRRECAVTPSTTLLEALRYGLGLTGSKQGCDKGDCGACTVVVDGEAILACISLALAFEGRDIRTVEGLAEGGRPHRLQDAFDVTGGAQCGFCTPGILMSAWALLSRNPSRSRAGIARARSGDRCRCTGYTKIFEAVELAASRLRGEADPVARPGGAAETR